ncbi:hypothetical protein NMQ01_10840 [Janibacter sp. CX7]|uniref:hypothetical protein n=1 Tax=Janibacter sp. CX7 TaxID=2963431 RepID=UPI0020CBFED0|nr:hypothetical protein [Janibacter sp. CX7]UTT65209.1 hypothetical protein NMQ01_10840 [Janibacter sp. CX7]
MTPAARGRAGTWFFLVLGPVFAASYAWLALDNALPGLLAGVPVALAGTGLLTLAQVRWHRMAEPDGQGWLSAAGIALVVGSIWAAFMTSNALA